MTNPLLGLGALGQSVWYDNLGRDLLRSGELRRLTVEDGVTGVTSNPTIFEKAIGTSKTYDNDLHLLVDHGLQVEEIYERLVIEDIREAADLLRPAYDMTAGADGYVSLEVSPALAYDRVGTVANVRRLFDLVDRRNLMIKVPATPQGLEALPELIGEGINVNVTLIFSLDQYTAAAEGYIRGLEKLTAEGGDPSRVASVASFFVSRVDTMIDEQLKDATDPAYKSLAAVLTGKAAIANARIAYALYKEIFQGEKFAAVRAAGARPQRVLWASTSTKNPSYPDTYYVEALIGPETVNTLPHATLEAYRDHGRPAERIQDGLDEAREVFSQLEEIGISVADVMDRLLEEGVRAFAESYEVLLLGIDKKRTRLLRGWGHRAASLQSLQKPVDDTLEALDRNRVMEALWAGEARLWTEDPRAGAEITQRLGWLQSVDIMMGERDRLRAFAEEIRSAGFTEAVLLGMGGSSLASEVFASSLEKADGFLRVTVLDTTVPGSILAVDRSLDLPRTLFIVSSKSGGTIEVTSLYKYFRNRVEQVLGDAAGGNFIAITDPGTSLGKLAAEHGFRRVFLNPPDIGGRFSAISYFGLVPFALMGADLDRLLMRAAQAVEASGPEVPSLESPGTWLGVIMGEAARAGRDKLTLILSPPYDRFGCWLEQLIAESTGKEGTGVLPIDGEPPGRPESYGSDRLFVYLRLDGDSTYDEQVSALEKSGGLVVTQRLHSSYDLGREIFRWEFATAVAGAILGINPFDQPNVQESKDITKQLLETFKREGAVPEIERFSADDPELAALIRSFCLSAKPSDYFAFNAFLHPSSEARRVLSEMRLAIRDRFRLATTLGFGPRYLHSTGQFHKGGPEGGIFVVITADDPEDVPIPGEPYSFGVLKTAQSLGDYQALKKRGKRIVRVHLRDESDLVALREAIKRVCCE